jgi:hypothetical protein
MMGTLIRARITPPLRRLTPTGAPVSATMILLITVSPTKPQTTDGMAARSSIVILSVSRCLLPENSEM